MKICHKIRSIIFTFIAIIPIACWSQSTHYFTYLNPFGWSQNIGSPKPSGATTQWIAFDFESTNFFATQSGITHFVMAGRSRWDSQEIQFHGLFIAAQGFIWQSSSSYPGNCPANDKARLYFEIRYPAAVDPTAGHITCADGYADKYFQDGTKYTFLMHIADEGMAYWIYKGSTLWSHNYLANTSFTARQDAYGNWVTISDVLANPASPGYAKYADRLINTEVIFTPVSPSTSSIWNIKISNLSSGWF